MHSSTIATGSRTEFSPMCKSQQPQHAMFWKVLQTIRNVGVQVLHWTQTSVLLWK